MCAHARKSNKCKRRTRFFVEVSFIPFQVFLFKCPTNVVSEYQKPINADIQNIDKIMARPQSPWTEQNYCIRIAYFQNDNILRCHSGLAQLSLARKMLQLHLHSSFLWKHLPCWLCVVANLDITTQIPNKNEYVRTMSFK